MYSISFKLFVIPITIWTIRRWWTVYVETNCICTPFYTIQHLISAILFKYDNTKWNTITFSTYKSLKLMFWNRIQGIDYKTKWNITNKYNIIEIPKESKWIPIYLISTVYANMNRFQGHFRIMLHLIFNNSFLFHWTYRQSK